MRIRNGLDGIQNVVRATIRGVNRRVAVVTKRSIVEGIPIGITVTVGVGTIVVVVTTPKSCTI